MMLAGRPESEGHADAAAGYREQIADFLVAHSFRQDHGGYLAFEGAAAYSFAMAGLVPMPALSAALARYSGPSAFALEADELRQEIERATEP